MVAMLRSWDSESTLKRPHQLGAKSMDKAGRFLVERSHALLDRAGVNLLPDKKRHNIWAERPRRRPDVSTRAGNHVGLSPLNELPEELLLHVMHHLDAPALLCLRRTSKKFMRLFSDKGFQGYHGQKSTERLQSENTKAMKTNKELRAFRELLGRDRLCDDCLIARQGPDSKMDEYLNGAEFPLHCSRCKVDHPSLCFSKKQRDLPPNRRICIAREGFVRLCRHKSLTWSDLESHVLNTIAPARRGCTIFSCEKKHLRVEVRFAFYGRSYRLALARGDRWMQDTSKFEYDWDEDDKMPMGEKDWCPDRDYTWLCAETEDGKRRPLVPESTWFRLVEPASFNITDDGERFGVAWCRTRSCPNYWRCFEVRRGRRVYLPCEEGCGGTS